MSTLGHVAIRFRSMVGEEAKAAYSRTFVNEYRRAWDKSWHYLCEMLEIIEREETYLKPWMKDGVPQPTYPTFASYCEAEVEPFVGPVANLREQYRRLKNGEVDVEGGAQNQKTAQTFARFREAQQALKAEGKEVTSRTVSEKAKAIQAERQGVTDPKEADTKGLSPRRAREFMAGGEMSTVDISPPQPTKEQKAKNLNVSRAQLHRIETVTKHPDLQERTELPKDNQRYLSVRAAYLQARKREGRPIDTIGSFRREVMKLDQVGQDEAFEWFVALRRQQGRAN